MHAANEDEVACAVYNAECAYLETVKLLQHFDDAPAKALVQMAEAQAKLLECIAFLADACRIKREAQF